MAIMIILQFMLQTGLIVVVAMYMIPTLHNIFFETGIENTISAETQNRINQLWIWSIIFFITGLAGNIFWFYQALQRKRREEVQF